MKKLILLICLCFISIWLFSQDATFMHDFSGSPYISKKYARVVKGSVFFKEPFLKGSIILTNGQEFKNQLIRFDLMENQLLYLDNKQQEMIATATLKEAVLFDSIINRYYFFVHSSFLKGESMPGTGWYERLATGKVFLLKQYKKELRETPIYGSSSTEFSISTELRYFVFNNGKWNLVKKMKNISELLSDKKSELLKFIKDQKLDTESEDNFISLINFYNSLQ